MAPPDLLGGSGGRAFLGILLSRVPRKSPAIPRRGVCGDLSTVCSRESFLESVFRRAKGELKIPRFFSFCGDASTEDFPVGSLCGDPLGEEKPRDFSSFLAMCAPADCISCELSSPREQVSGVRLISSDVIDSVAITVKGIYIQCVAYIALIRMLTDSMFFAAVPFNTCVSSSCFKLLDL
jgi:hypothetical protein